MENLLPDAEYPMFVIDRDTLRFLVANDRATETYGYDEGGFRAMTLADLRHPEDREHTYVAHHRIDSLTVGSGPLRHVTAEGEVLHAQLISTEAQHRGRPVLIVLVIDVSESVRNDERRVEAFHESSPPKLLAASGIHLERAQKLANIGSWDYDFLSDELICSESLYDLLGVPPETALPAYPLRPFVHPDDRARVERSLIEARTGDGKYHAEHRLVRPDETVRLVEVRAKYEFDSAHAPIKVTGILSDISHRAEMRPEVVVVQNDPLTQLPVRETIVAMTNLALFKAQTSDERLAVYFVSCGGVGEVNEAFGHAFGDMLVAQIAARLTSVLEGKAAVGRWGGHEFLIVAPFRAAESHERILAAVLKALERAFIHEGHGVHAFPSIGVSLFPEHGDTADDLIRNADTAMSVARERRANHVVFSWPMYEHARERISIHGGLKNALERNEFVLAFQPIVDARTNAAAGVEALLRWRHPERGLLFPDSFIGIAETSDMIVPLGRWAIREACRMAAEWRDQGLDLFVAVNVSPRQFQNDDLVKVVMEALDAVSLSPKNVEIELTENGLMEDLERAVRVMKELRSKGVRFSLDDFGTGHSSLARFQSLPLDTLKVDRTFVRDMQEGEFSAALVTSIIQLGRAKGLWVIGEGVETEEQFTLLRRLGCTHLQGYCIAKPLWPEDVPAFAAGRTRRSRESALEDS